MLEALVIAAAVIVVVAMQETGDRWLCWALQDEDHRRDTARPPLRRDP